MNADDGLPIDQVGPWAKEKHEWLRKYVDISRATRRRWIDKSNPVTYVDLFCGSGRSIIRGTREVIDGSPLVAFKSARAGGVPFSQIYIADVSEEKCRAAQERILRAGGAAEMEIGEAEETAVRIAGKLNPYGLHFIFLDPYNLESLPLSVIKAFAKLKYIDLLIHVSAIDLQRNLHSYTMPGDTRLERFSPGWRAVVDLRQSKRAIRAAILAHWVSNMEALKLPTARHAQLVSGTRKNQRLYWLVFASHSEFANGLWDKLAIASRQRELPL